MFEKIYAKHIWKYALYLCLLMKKEEFCPPVLLMKILPAPSPRTCAIKQYYCWVTCVTKRQSVFLNSNYFFLYLLKYFCIILSISLSIFSKSSYIKYYWLVFIRINKICTKKFHICILRQTIKKVQKIEKNRHW